MIVTPRSLRISPGVSNPGFPTQPLGPERVWRFVADVVTLERPRSFFLLKPAGQTRTYLTSCSLPPQASAASPLIFRSIPQINGYNDLNVRLGLPPEM